MLRPVLASLLPLLLLAARPAAGTPMDAEAVTGNGKGPEGSDLFVAGGALAEAALGVPSVDRLVFPSSVSRGLATMLPTSFELGEGGLLIPAPPVGGLVPDALPDGVGLDAPDEPAPAEP